MSLFLAIWNMIHKNKSKNRQHKQFRQLKFVVTIVVTVFLQFGQVQTTGVHLKFCGLFIITELGTTWLDATTGWTYDTGWNVFGCCGAGAIFDCGCGIFCNGGLYVWTLFWETNGWFNKLFWEFKSVFVTNGCWLSGILLG